jgi:tRNA (guanine37-N1)-methyltransferase
MKNISGICAMKFDIISLFPEFFDSPFMCGTLRIAVERRIVEIRITNPRDFTKDGTVDDYQFGGGAGMVIKPEPLIKAVNHVMSRDALLVSLTPQGRQLEQSMIREMTTRQHIIIMCGRYKGMDNRVRDVLEPCEISIGDYVLSGGETGALVLIEAIARLLPGTLGNEDSASSDSFEEKLLAPAIYTRPRTFKRRSVPHVLRSGNHRLIQRWRRKDAVKKTLTQRPDLFSSATYKKGDLEILLEVLNGKKS